MSKILILGVTGAMAIYLTPKLLEAGHDVTGVSLDDLPSDFPPVRHIKGNAMDKALLQELLSEGFDAVVDFMIYTKQELFAEYYPLFLQNTKHYVFLSTYRVYAGDCPITEESLRILDMERPDDFVCDLEYCIYKAQEEDLLRQSGYKNFTIVRPAITYSQCRLQLVTIEANVVVQRMRQGKTVILPESAMEHQATMTWAGDVADMLAAILLNPQAYGETYTLATAEHHTWREVAEMYVRIGGLKYITVNDEEYVQMLGGNAHVKQQLQYDRCYDRVVDNTKILALCGKRQAELMPLEEGLRREYESLTAERLSRIGYWDDVNQRMDEYLASRGMK